MNQLRETLDRELNHVQATPAALAAIRGRVTIAPRRSHRSHRPRRPWLIALGGLVPLGAAGAVVAVLLTGGGHDMGQPATPAVGVLQQSSPSSAPSSDLVSPAPEPTGSSQATPSGSPQPGPTGKPTPAVFFYPLSVRSHATSIGQTSGVTLRGTIPLVEVVNDSAGPPGNATLPRAEQEQAAVDALNAEIRARIAALAAGAFGDIPLTGTVSTQVLEHNSHIAAVYVTSETTTSIAAHPDDEISSFVIDLDDATILDPTRFFIDDTKALDVLSTRATALLRAQIPKVDLIIKSKVAPTQENFRYLTPTADGLRIDFAYYQVGNRAANAPHVVIPWSVVDPLLTPATAILFGR